MYYRFCKNVIFISILIKISSEPVAGSAINDIGIPIDLTGDEGNDSDKQEEIHLEDFFWTGSGDGPPEYLKKIHTGINKGKDVIVKTETVVATVYVDGKNDVDDPPICVDCTNNGLPLNYTATDRRYWLLTVVSGYFRPKDYLLLEDKLAKLYRIAFTRQQTKHLGIENRIMSQQINENLSNNRSKRQTNDNKKINNNLDLETFDYNLESNKNVIKNSTKQLTSINNNSDKKTSVLENSLLLNAETYLSEENKSKDNNANLKVIQTIPESSGRYFDDEKSVFGENQVRVLIHNLTLLTEDDIHNWDEQDVNDKRDSRPLANQTEIIYSVFVNGKPVMATTAADDMKLVSEDEVSTIMGKTIYMKAEPYLKEPQATPLVPSMKTSDPDFFTYVHNNSVLIAITSIAFMLILLLILALLLMTRAKRQRSADLKRVSVRNEFLDDNQPTHRDFDTTRTDATALSRVDFTESNRGIQNYGYEQDTKQITKKNRPYISFPLPPGAQSRPHSSSTESTSDSSVYCPVNRPNVDLQHMLDEKAAKLFEKKKKSTKFEQSEPIYTAVASTGATKKRDKKPKTKHQRRRYLSENRVGSIDEVDSSADTSISNESVNGGEHFKTKYQNYEHNETYNLHNQYNRNKIMNNRVFTDKMYDSVHEEVATPTEAINREIINALQPQYGERSSETGSIGSFLSMTSVRNFPKNPLPEPLNRVLEPVSVTHYDHYDDSTMSKMKTVATIEKHPYKVKNVAVASQSDNPDPGVIGPIVWEIHKKHMSRGESEESPIHDPVETRNRFEGLLEGAMQLYDDVPPIPRVSVKRDGSKNFNKENRGRSAMVASATNRFSVDNRPLTAGFEKTTKSNNSTKPPSPDPAWGSGSQSPRVRPLSAGPFHRPEPPSVDVTRVLASQNADKAQLTAAPLIEAIQIELQKFKRENSQ